MHVGIAQRRVHLTQLCRGGHHPPETQEIEAVGGHLPSDVDAPGNHRQVSGVNGRVHPGKMGDDAVAVEVQIPDLSLPALGWVKHTAAGDLETHDQS